MSEPKAKVPALAGVRRALSHTGFRRYWIGMAISTIGFWGYRVALGWLVWELTHSPSWLGIIAFAEMVPMTLVGPVAGAITDRVGALRMARISQFGWAVAIGLLCVVTVLGLASKESLLILAVIQGVASGFSNPSHMALVAKLVPRSELSTAIAMQSGIVQTGRFIGPALAGPLLVLSGPALVFGLVSLGFLCFVVMLFMTETLEPEVPGKTSNSLLGDFIEGLKYTQNHFAIRTIMLYTALMAVLLRSLPELMPGFADAVFGRGETGLAWLMAAFGIGSIISAVWLAIRADPRGLVKHFSLNILIGALALLAFGFVDNIWIGLILVAISGFSTNTVSMASQTLVQTSVDGRMRARVMGLLGITFRAIPALGALILGLGQSAAGFGAPIIIAAVLCLGVWMSLTRTIRKGDLREQAERTATDRD